MNGWINRNCPLCNSEESEKIHISVGPILTLDNPFRVPKKVEAGILTHYVKCENCGMTYQNPTVIKRDKLKTIPELMNTSNINTAIMERKEEHNKYLSEIFDSPPDKVLDIGFTLLSSTSYEGKKVAFIDPLEEERYDLIILQRYLSFVADPVEELNKTKELLNENGLIYIIESDPETDAFCYDVSRSCVFYYATLSLLTEACSLEISDININGTDLSILAGKKLPD